MTTNDTQNETSHATTKVAKRRRSESDEATLEFEVRSDEHASSDYEQDVEVYDSHLNPVMQTPSRLNVNVQRSTHANGTSTSTAQASYYRSQISRLEAQIAETQQKLNITCMSLRPTLAAQSQGLEVKMLSNDEILVQARRIIERRIKALTRYNQTKDAAMGLLGMVADRDGKRLKVVMGARNIDGGEE